MSGPTKDPGDIEEEIVALYYGLMAAAREIDDLNAKVNELQAKVGSIP
jgi:hypothetical protein